MSPLAALAVLGAGLAAGAVNVLVGSGSLITFPTLLALGYSPVIANVSNTLGLVPGSVSGAVGYRRELAGQGPRLRRLAPIAVAGGLSGGVLLVVVPGAFSAVVPVLILLACALMAAQPRLVSRLERQGCASAPSRPGHKQEPRQRGLPAAVFLTAVYGGYFGAAQGVLLLAVLSLFVDDDLQRLNGAKNVLVAMVNGVAAALFVVVAEVELQAAALIALGATAGAQLGARLARRIPAPALRYVVVTGGVVVAAVLIVR